MIKILVADDHALIREGIKKMLEKEVDMSIAGEVEDSFAVLDFVRNNPCDVVILDISMPGKNGLELLKEIKIFKPEMKVLILTMHPEDRFAIRTLKAGASGYLTKMSAPVELTKAIRKVYTGGKYISHTLAEKLAFTLDSTADEQAAHEALSDREYEVFCLIAAGKTTAETANALSISQSTVNTYRLRIFEKMDFHNNAEIIQYALRHNILE